MVPTTFYHATVNGVTGMLCHRRGRHLFLPWTAGRVRVLRPDDQVEVRQEAAPEMARHLLATLMHQEMDLEEDSAE